MQRHIHYHSNPVTEQDVTTSASCRQVEPHVEQATELAWVLTPF